MSSLESFVSQLPTRASTPFAFLVVDLDIGIREPIKPAILERGSHSNQVPNPNSSPHLVRLIHFLPRDPMPDSFGPWLLVSRKKLSSKAKTDTSNRSPQSPYQEPFPPTRHHPIPHHIPIPNMVKETELGANNGKRKLVSPTTLTPKLNYKPKPKALSPTKHTKA